jgi:hypothetical protein
MTMQKNAKFIRIVHLETAKGSLYLSDLDSEENKKNEYKIPVYIPYGTTIDILLTDRTLTSYQQGSIRGFVDKGLLEAFVVQNVKVENVEDTLPSYDITIDDELITVDTSNGDVLLNLPNLDYEMRRNSSTTGKKFTFKKVSQDANKVFVAPYIGDFLEGSNLSVSLEAPLGFVTLQSDKSGNWWIINQSGGGGDVVPPPPPPADFISTEEVFDIEDTTTTSITLSSTPYAGTDKVFWNGVDLVRGVGKDYIIDGDTVIFHPDIKLFPDDRIKVTYQIPS